MSTLAPGHTADFSPIHATLMASAAVASVLAGWVLGVVDPVAPPTPHGTGMTVSARPSQPSAEPSSDCWISAEALERRAARGIWPPPCVLARQHWRTYPGPVGPQAPHSRPHSRSR